MNDKFFKSVKHVESIAEGHGYCFVSAKVCVDENEIKYCYREKPGNDTDSGWRFFAGDEDDEYCANPDNFHIFDINTVCNFDKNIIDILEEPYPISLTKDGTIFIVDDEDEEDEDE